MVQVSTPIMFSSLPPSKKEDFSRTFKQYIFLSISVFDRGTKYSFNETVTVTAVEMKTTYIIL
jgi:hypothetical protein